MQNVLTPSQIKATFQKDAATTWWKAGARHTLQICTGGGKTRIGIMIVKALLKLYGPDLKVLIITPTEVIRDNTWPDEFKKWNESELLNYCEIECIQTVYKWEDRFFHLVIADEIHNYLSDQEYTNFFHKNQYKHLLGLSALVPDNKLSVLNFIAPICLTLTLKEAVAKGLVSPHKIINIPVSLTPEEGARYAIVDRNYKYYEKVLGGSTKAWATADKWKTLFNENVLMPDRSTKKKSQVASIYFGLVQKRKGILYNAANKIVYANTILDSYKERVIIFSESKEFTNSLASSRNGDTVVYHSGLSDTKKKANLARFADFDVDYLATVRALNEGMDIPSVRIGIIASGNGSEKDFLQRVGRTVRFEDDKIAYIYQFYVPGTQEEKWVENRMYGFDSSSVIWLTSINDLIKL